MPHWPSPRGSSSRSRRWTRSAAAQPLELAPNGWTGREAAGPGDVATALAANAAERSDLAPLLAAGTLDDRERWLEFFAAGAFGPGHRRLWIFERDAPLPVPAVAVTGGLALWEPIATIPTAPKRSPAERLRGRAGREWAVISEVARLRVARLRGAGRAR